MEKYCKNYSNYENLTGWERLSFSQWLHRLSEQYKNNIALLEGNKTITYQELDKMATARAALLSNKGVKQDDKILLQLPNTIEFVAWFFGIIRAGAIPILILPAHREAVIEGIAESAKPVGYIFAKSYLGYNYIPMVKKIKNKFDFIKLALMVDDNTPIDSAELFKEPEIDSYNNALMLLSGGTTNIPKLIPKSHSEYIYNAYAAAKKCDLNEQSIYLAVLPLAHTFPLVCPGILGTLLCGGKVVLCPIASVDEILDKISEQKVTITALVPSLLSLCLELLEFDADYDTSSLKTLQIGGAILTQSLANHAEKILPNTLMQVFGTSEGLICFTSMKDSREVVASCQGKPISDADEIKIVDERGNQLQAGEIGELVFKGPYTFAGYYNAESINKCSFMNDGFYRSGDKAMIDKEGNLHIIGRIVEQINRGGEKIMPYEVEDGLCKHPEIDKAVVIGVPDEDLGNSICAFVISESNIKLTRDDIYSHLYDLGLSEYKIPDKVEYIDEFPLTPVGKIDKKALLEIVYNEV